MLDKLVISKKNSGESRMLHRLLISTFVVVTSLLSFALVYSLFTQNFVMGQENLNISTLIAPPALPQEVPPDKQREEIRDKRSTPKLIVRRFNIQRIDEPPVKTPKKISTNRSKYRTRPNVPFVLGGPDSTESAADILRQSGPRCTTGCSGSTGIDRSPKGPTEVTATTKTPKNTVPKPPPIIKRTKKPIIKSLGVINGKAIKLAKPGYPPAARAMRISGKVTIQVMISEQGNVISASPVSGHALLRRPAVIAARASKFTPTKLSNVPVKVRGLIVYNFRP